MDPGAFAPGDPKLLTFAILGAVNWIPRWFDPDRTRDVGGDRDACSRRISFKTQTTEKA